MGNEPFCLSTKKDDYGTVYYIPITSEPEPVKLSDSFTDFINSLEEGLFD